VRFRIFTEKERSSLLRWLKDDGREPYLNRVLSRVNQNRHCLLADCKLFIAVLRKYDAGY